MINIRNIDDNDCFKWCLVRYLRPADHNLRRITKAEKLFGDEVDFEDIKFIVNMIIVEENTFVVIVCKFLA